MRDEGGGMKVLVLKLSCFFFIPHPSSLILFSR